MVVLCIISKKMIPKLKLFHDVFSPSCYGWRMISIQNVLRARGGHLTKHNHDYLSPIVMAINTVVPNTTSLHSYFSSFTEVPVKNVTN